jgi:DNA-binding NtrC family response regulator
MSSDDQPTLETGSDNLSGLRVLVVEDSWHIGMALKSLLRALGADVLGPVPTAEDAKRLLCDRPPHVSIVDFNLRGGEIATDLIDSLNGAGVSVIVISGYASLPLAPGKVKIVLQKPIVESQLLAALRPLAAKRAN